MNIYFWIAQITNLPIPKPSLNSGTTSNVLKIVFGVAGGISALIVTVAAMQYVLSMGDPASTAKAKNTILYALVGLLVCAAAFSIVAFVVDRL